MQLTNNYQILEFSVYVLWRPGEACSFCARQKPLPRLPRAHSSRRRLSTPIFLQRASHPLASTALLVISSSPMDLSSEQQHAVSCAYALAHAFTDGALSYFSLLPRAVACIVDQLILLNAWRWTGKLASVSLPLPTSGSFQSARSDSLALPEGKVLILRSWIARPTKARVCCDSNVIPCVLTVSCSRRGPPRSILTWSR